MLGRWGGGGLGLLPGEPLGTFSCAGNDVSLNCDEASDIPDSDVREYCKDLATRYIGSGGGIAGMWLRYNCEVGCMMAVLECKTESVAPLTFERF